MIWYHLIYRYLIVTHMKFRGISGIPSPFSYIGQCDLINTCFGLLQVWYTPGRQCVYYMFPDIEGIDFHFN